MLSPSTTTMAIRSFQSFYSMMCGTVRLHRPPRHPVPPPPFLVSHGDQHIDGHGAGMATMKTGRSIEALAVTRPTGNLPGITPVP